MCVAATNNNICAAAEEGDTVVRVPAAAIKTHALMCAGESDDATDTR